MVTRVQLLTAAVVDSLVAGPPVLPSMSVQHAWKQHWVLWALSFVSAWFSGTMAKPAASLARSSSLGRSRRSIMPSSPQSQRAQLPAHAPHPSHARQPHHAPHTQHSLPSPDPDILSVSSCPALYRNEEEEEAIYFSAEKQWYWQWMKYSMCLAGWVGGRRWVGRSGVWY